jgi:hypothetical protein
LNHSNPIPIHIDAGEKRVRATPQPPKSSFSTQSPSRRPSLDTARARPLRGIGIGGQQEAKANDARRASYPNQRTSPVRRVYCEQGASFLTRHGLHALNHTAAAATALRPTALLVPDPSNGDPMAASDHQFSTGNPRASRHCRNKANDQTRRSGCQTIPTVGQKSNSP